MKMKNMINTSYELKMLRLRILPLTVLDNAESQQCCKYIFAKTFSFARIRRQDRNSSEIKKNNWSLYKLITYCPFFY